MTIVGDKRISDASKLGRGRVSVSGVTDMATRRMLESNNQSNDYFYRKVQDIVDVDPLFEAL